MKSFTKNSLIQELIEIRNRGWIENRRHGNAGAVGNTLEDLLGIEENNLPIPNAAEWELKTQRETTSSLITLFHFEPSPRSMKLVPSLLLPKYGWEHQEAGGKYPNDEMSFRQTIGAHKRSDRGFGISVDRNNDKICVSFDCNFVDPRHSAWLEDVKKNAGLGELSPQPYWGFNDFLHKLGTKLHNCFFVAAQEKKEGNKRYIRYTKIYMLKDIDLDGIIEAIEDGNILVDFDARTRHNHGTKFRLREKNLPTLYREVIEY